ncbi:MAG: hypothetical protein RL154_245 [Pseudomonadota bacterium]|jgi:KUP system potassium uptake protein
MTNRQDIVKVIRALGAVYGDIGTSPLYTLAVLILFVPLNPHNVIEILSMLFWTLIILVSVQYAWLAMSVSSHGEGGAIVLAKALKNKLKNPKAIYIVSLLSILGVSLLMGDGVITPAISILSAVEGSKLIDMFSNISTDTIVIVSTIITVALFSVQYKGVEKISSSFGPIMVLWFIAIGGIGLWNMFYDLSVLKAINPMYAVMFIINQPVIAFVMLGSVILCATGGEALYADMGQLGREPILKGWVIVFIALIFCYFGQGAYVITHPNDSANPLFAMVKSFSSTIYVPFVILAVAATIIASQAMISGVFSMVYQLINVRALPRLKVTYTSDEVRSQIYVGFINWTLFAFVVLMLIVFKKSDSLAAAYGLSVAGAMALTGIFLFFTFMLQKSYLKMFFALISGAISSAFFASCLLKIPDGGYWSVIIALSIFLIIMLYAKGQARLYAAFTSMPRKEFLTKFADVYANKPKLEGTALFFVRKLDEIPAYVTKTMFSNGILYQNNVLVMIKIEEEARGVDVKLLNLQDGIKALIINAGYMEILNGGTILKSQNMEGGRAIFYGQEDISSKNFIFKIYALMKLLTPSFVSFYRLSPDKLIGVIRRIEI